MDRKSSLSKRQDFSKGSSTLRNIGAHFAELKWNATQGSWHFTPKVKGAYRHATVQEEEIFRSGIFRNIPKWNVPECAEIFQNIWNISSNSAKDPVHMHTFSACFSVSLCALNLCEFFLEYSGIFSGILWDI